MNVFPHEADTVLTCRVTYGTDPSFSKLPYTNTLTKVASVDSEENISVSISEALNSTTTYYYLVSALENGKIFANVQGSFSTGIFGMKIKSVPFQNPLIQRIT